MMIKTIVRICSIALLIAACTNSKKPVISPDVITESTLNDTDDPAIWLHPQDPSKSIVFGTDKESNGAIYAFDLRGKIIPEKTIRNIKRPNNVDVEYGLRLNDSTTVDILAFTERERNQIRVFSLPEMRPLDQGGFQVFEDEKSIEHRLPMGIGLYKSPKDGSIYAVVGRKSGPEKDYLYQYKLVVDSSETVQLKRVRKLGNFSGKKEIEAIAVDDENGFIYYADEGVCLRKYYAEPEMGSDEIDCFGGEHFASDIEGIAIAKTSTDAGFLIVSDQQRGQFNIFTRQDNTFVKAINLGTQETDGCEVVTTKLNPTFSKGLFVAMNDERNFYFYDLAKLNLTIK